MKQPERVAELLAELRALAETDFERHRIDVLERDLTAPPVVEVIDDTHQRFNGVTYRESKSGHFVVTGLLLHRVVWEYYHGEIPSGYAIHHQDFFKANNDIYNLQMMRKSEHKRLHNLSTEMNEYTCEFCGKGFFSRSFVRPRFCSSRCQVQMYREKNQEIKTCPVCGKEFKSSKYVDSVCCSRACGQKLSWVAKKSDPSTLEIKMCAHCGKPFSSYRSTTLFCSKQCSDSHYYHEHKDGNKENRLCAFCGKPFTASKYKKTKCCSKSCGRRLGLITQKKRQATLLQTPLKIDVVASKPTESSITDE